MGAATRCARRGTCRLQSRHPGGGAELLLTSSSWGTRQRSGAAKVGPRGLVETQHFGLELRNSTLEGRVGRNQSGP